VITSVGVYALSLLVALLLGPWLGQWPLLLRSAASTVLVVAGLTWVIMPLLTRLTRGWLRAQPLTEKTKP
jgi:antibiotic biosynthesis monooxygenase (ABM) superfamily enzyme